MSVLREHRAGHVLDPAVALDDELAEPTEDVPHRGLVLDLGQSADRSAQVHGTADRLVHSTTVREVSPGERPVVVDGRNRVEEEVLPAVAAHVQRGEDLLAEPWLAVAMAYQNTQLPDSVGDVPVTVGTPATDEPDEVVRLVPAVGLLLDVNDPLGDRLHHGEPEALVDPG